MSVSRNPVTRLLAAVSSRLASVCQKGNPVRPRRKRDPYTTSASPCRMGSISPGSSIGSYSRSASWTTTTSPLASAKPRCNAAPFSREHMRENIHPAYPTAKVHCACGATWETRSTHGDLHLDICSNCHPFFTGKQKLIDTQGRIDRFKKKYANAPATPPKKKAAAK